MFSLKFIDNYKQWEKRFTNIYIIEKKSKNIIEEIKESKYINRVFSLFTRKENHWICCYVRNMNYFISNVD